MSTLQTSEIQDQDLTNDTTGFDELKKAMDELKNFEPQEEEILEEEQDKDENLNDSESDNSENDEPHEEEENTQEEPQKLKKEDPLWKQKKRAFQALAQRDAALEKAEKLEQMLNEALNAGTFHYGKSAYSDLEKAKESKKRALEEGNTDAFMEADEKFYKALQVVNELEKLSKNNTPYATKQEAPVYQEDANDYDSIKREIAEDWISSHPYLNPESSNYDPRLTKQVTNFVNQLDTNLQRNNQGDAYFSDEYFETIDNYIYGLQDASKKTQKNRETANYIGGVRNPQANNLTASRSTNERVILTPEEKQMAYSSGVSEKDWLRFKIADLKKVRA